MLFNILYVEVKESINLGSFILTYYLLKHSGNYINSVEDEKSYNSLSLQNYEELLFNVSSLVNKLDSEDVYVFTISDTSLLSKVLFEAKDLGYIKTKVVLEDLVDYIGYKNHTIFQVYVNLFGTSQKVSYLEMLDLIINFKVKSNILLKYGVSNNGLFIQATYKSDTVVYLTFCWFTITFFNHIIYLGSDSLCLNIDSESYFEIENFFLKLNFNLASCGVCESSVVPVFYSDLDRKGFESCQHKCGVSSLRFIENGISLTKILSSVKGLPLSKYSMFYKYTTKNITTKSVTKDALNIIDNLKSIEKSLKLAFKDNSLVCLTETYIKDFSSDNFNVISDHRQKYGIILDCEGNSDNSCSEVGGIIFGKYEGYLIKLETFSFTDLDFTESLNEVINRFEKISGRYLPSRGIDIITYGATDEFLISNSLKGNKNKPLRRKVEKVFNYINCIDYINNYITNNGIVPKSRKLSDIAESLNVLVVQPKHNALNDSKTLFNVLSRIVLDGEKFII